MSSNKINVSKSEIFKIVSFFQMFYLPFGLCRIKCHNDKILKVAKSYKIYATFVIVALTTLLVYLSHLDIQTTIHLYEKSVSLVATNALYYYFLIVTFVLVIFHSTYLDVNITKIIYQDFLEIDEFFKSLGKNYNLYSYFILLSHFAPYVLFKVIYLILSYLAWYQFNIWGYHIANFVIDIEIIRFSIEINIVLRSLRVLRNTVNYDFIHQPIIAIKTNHEDEVHLIDLINVYNKLIVTIEKLNSCYSTKVCEN